MKREVPRLYCLPRQFRSRQILGVQRRDVRAYRDSDAEAQYGA